MSNDTPVITLKRGKEVAVKRRHHWIFSGAIHTIDGNPADGAEVVIKDFRDQIIGIGHYQRGSISVRIISFKDENIDDGFWERKLKSAFRVRQAAGLTDRDDLDSYRLVHGEGDLLPGLVIDKYANSFVIQTHSFGMFAAVQEIKKALLLIFPKTNTIYHKTNIDESSNSEIDSGLLYGEALGTEIIEYNNKFIVDWQQGQKTGFFLDQRENRRLLSTFSTGKSVLNAFCYTGGFSVNALNAGAKSVHSIDASAKAIELLDKNISLNNVAENHTGICSKLIPYLNSTDEKFDLVVLDPPAYAKRLSAKSKAIRGYRSLNEKGIDCLKDGGVLFTFSCSQVITRDQFRNIILAAAYEKGKTIRILHELGQPADHPINMFHPETSYLKGLVLQIESE